MAELVHQLGIDWRLLISQAVNFLILFFVLKTFVYAPVLRALKERERKISEGIMKAEESERRLHEVDDLAKKKLGEADQKALALIKKTEGDAKLLEEKLAKQAEEKGRVLIREAELAAREKEEEGLRALHREAAGIVKQAIVKTVELSPDTIDNALIEKALRGIESKQ